MADALIFLLPREVASQGWYRYYEWIGSAPDLVEVTGDPPAVLKTPDGHEMALLNAPGCFEGPLD